MTPEMFFDFLAVRLNGPEAADVEATFNVDLGEEGGKYLLELDNGVLNHTAGVQADDADATVTLSRDALNKIILQETTLAEAMDSGDVKVEGDTAKLGTLVDYLDPFEVWFNIVEP